MYECGARQKYPIMFEKPVQLVAGKWYVAWARISGPSNDSGSSGQGQVSTEVQIMFCFKSSKKCQCFDQKKWKISEALPHNRYQVKLRLHLSYFFIASVSNIYLDGKL